MAGAATRPPAWMPRSSSGRDGRGGLGYGRGSSHSRWSPDRVQEAGVRSKMLFIALSLVGSLAGLAAADETGNFIIRLGRDTTGVENFTRSAKGVEVRQVGRAPRVLQRRFFYEMGADGVLKSLTLTVTNPAD